jgi:hypothetical protein
MPKQIGQTQVLAGIPKTRALHPQNILLAVFNST